MNSSSEPELLENICRIICETGEYRMAWVGYAEDNQDKSVRPMAHSGFEDGYLSNINISWADNERGQGPTGAAIRANEIIVNRDFASNPMLLLWREKAIKRGYSSSIAVPLAIEAGDGPIGALMIYSEEADAFDNAEIGLLKTLATLLSHGIISIRREKAKSISEKALRESEKRFRELIENAIFGRFIIEKEQISYANPKFAQIFGYDKDEILKVNLLHLLSNEEKTNIDLLIKGLADGDIESFHIVTNGIRKGGDSVDIELDMFAIQHSKSRVLTGTVIDITKRKRAEFDLKISREEYRLLTSRVHSLMEEERERISREVHDELGQSLSAIKMDINYLKKNMFDDSGSDLLNLLKRLNDTSDLIDNTIGSVRRIAYELRPSILDDIGVIEAMKSYIFDFQKRTGITCNIKSNIEHVNFSKDPSTALYRILQEALTNVARHSEADMVSIVINNVGKDLIVDLKDNGIGIATGGPARKSLGILGMKERASAVGGRVDVKGAGGKGTSVTVTMPLMKAENMKNEVI